MHSVVIGISRDDDLVVSEVVHVVLYTKCVDQQIQLLVLSNLLSAFLVAVDRLSTQTEYCLCLCLARFCDCTARRVSLGDEDAGIFSQFLLGCRKLVVVVNLAVAKLPVIYIGTLVPFLCLLLDGRYLLPLLFGLGDLLLKDRDDVLVDMEIIVQIGLYEIIDIASDGRALVV